MGPGGDRAVPGGGVSQVRPSVPTQAELRHALNLGAGWEVLWTGASPLDTHDHLCGGLHGPGGTYVNEWVRLPYTATGRPGIKAAWCARCRVAWVRRDT